MKHHIPVGQSSSKVALDVGVHDWLKVLEFTVLKEVDDMDLEVNREDKFKKNITVWLHEDIFFYALCSLWFYL